MFSSGELVRVGSWIGNSEYILTCTTSGDQAKVPIGSYGIILEKSHLDNIFNVIVGDRIVMLDEINLVLA